MSWSKTELQKATNDDSLPLEEQNRLMDMISIDIADILSQIKEWPSKVGVREVSDIRPKTIADVQHLVAECNIKLRMLRRTVPK